MRAQVRRRTRCPFARAQRRTRRLPAPGDRDQRSRNRIALHVNKYSNVRTSCPHHRNDRMAVDLPKRGSKRADGSYSVPFAPAFPLVTAWRTRREHCKKPERRRSGGLGCCSTVGSYGLSRSRAAWSTQLSRTVRPPDRGRRGSSAAFGPGAGWIGRTGPGATDEVGAAVSVVSCDDKGQRERELP